MYIRNKLNSLSNVQCRFTVLLIIHHCTVNFSYEKRILVIEIIHVFNKLEYSLQHEACKNVKVFKIKKQTAKQIFSNFKNALKSKKMSFTNLRFWINQLNFSW